MAPTRDQVDLQSFLLDLENWVLTNRWDMRLGVPCGRLRHVGLWGEVMRVELLDYPRRQWSDYCDWVLSGGGDDWFQEAEQNPAYYRESAMPLPANVNGHDPTADDLRRVGQAGG